MLIRFVGLILLAMLATGAAFSGPVTFQAHLRSRFEMWDWFQPDTADPTYGYLGNQLRFNIGQTGEKIDWQLDFAAPVLLGLPDNAIAPAPQGQLGVGASYYASNDNHRNAAMVFPKQAFLRFKGKQFSLRLGRFEFLDGSEIAPKNATLAALKRDRINQRLIGAFGWTHVGRSFDGFHYSRNAGTGNLTWVTAIPTRGVFQVDGWGWNKTALSYLSYSQPYANGKSTGETRVFGIYYHDWRHVTKTDNRPSSARTGEFGNIRIGSFGGHWIHALETDSGTVDFLAWGVAQTGRWGNLDHRAGAGALEAGWQPNIAPKLKPWFRFGFFDGSGDKDPADKQHRTFFQILPTPRPFARFPFFNLMNQRDWHGAMILRPAPKLSISSEFHAMRLASENDLWYLGGGAYQPWSFGYVGRPVSGARGFANLYDIAADYRINERVSVNGYFGFANGRSVMKTIYPKGRDGAFGYVELNWRIW
jgi:hypothetical protein